MSTEIKVPPLPESVADATVASWYVKPGVAIARDEPLLELETDKVTIEVPAPADGTIESVSKNEGEVVTAGEVLALFKEGAAPAATPSASAAEPVASPEPTPAPVSNGAGSSNASLSPSVRRLVAEKDVDTKSISGSGKGGRITKSDVVAHLQGGSAAIDLPVGTRPEKRVPMTRLRARIAERLLSAQHESAMLTTFNEVDLTEVMALRAEYKDKFEKTHGVKLGFMSFFVKAAIEALKRFPVVNASIDGDDIVYHGYFDIGVAVSTERGLVVPVLRNADSMSMAEIEANIGDYAGRARDGKLSLEEMTGGTFTITNGGIFGSLLSTPILNQPQCAILGMHKIEKRPVVVNDEIAIRSMMYLAMSYDHRLIDGRESVQFLLTIKQLLEEPARLLLEI